MGRIPTRSIAVRMAAVLALTTGGILALLILVLGAAAESAFRRESAEANRRIASHIATELEREVTLLQTRLRQAEEDPGLARPAEAGASTPHAETALDGRLRMGPGGASAPAGEEGPVPAGVPGALRRMGETGDGLRLLESGGGTLLLLRAEAAETGTALGGWIRLDRLLEGERAALVEGHAIQALRSGPDGFRPAAGTPAPADAVRAAADTGRLPLRIVSWTPAEVVRATARRLKLVLAAAGLAFLGCGLLAQLLVMRRTLLTPLRRLRESAHDAARRGAGTLRTDPTDAEEIRELATVFNEMQSALRERAGALETANDRLREEVAQRGHAEGELLRHRNDLELVVTERTRQLEEANQELEAVNRGLENRVRERTGMLLQAEKMASVGQLAAGIAHEINNPAGFVSGNLETLRTYATGLLQLAEAYETLVDRLAAAGAVSRADLEHIRETSARINLDFIREDLADILAESIEGMERIGKIVNDLKDFSHVDKDDAAAENDLNELVEKAVNVAWNELKYKCEVRKDYGELPPLGCNGGRISQVILNLLVNAAQAIESRGEIRISTALRDDAAELTIADTGPGIPPEILTRIYDPFFTTKPVGKGTGLGLHICQKIIGAHGGTIAAENAPEGGAVFRVRLPLQPSRPGGAPAPAAAAAGA
jgi:signal transduction histidine kinase